jgi:hypothetical protein
MTEGTENTPMTPREMGDFYKTHIMVIVGDVHASDFLILERGARGGSKTALPGGYFDHDDFAFADYRLGFMDDLESASPEITEGLRAILAERPQAHPSDFLGDPFFFDRSGSMSDSVLREMVEEVHTIMGDFFPLELAPGDIDARMASLFDNPFARETRELRIEYDETMAAKRMVIDVPYFERDTHGGTPRSIKETRRAQGRGKRQNAMSNWKRK